MKKEVKKRPSCDACETDFQNEIHELVDNVEGHHTGKEHNEKQKELNKAFDVENSKK